MKIRHSITWALRSAFLGGLVMAQAHAGPGDQANDEVYDAPPSAFSTVNKLNVRELPRAGSRVVLKLKFGDHIMIKRRQARSVNIGSKRGRWAKIAYTTCRGPGGCRDIVGWTFDYFLAYPGNLDKEAKAITSWNKGDIKFCIKDDGCWGYKMANNGEFLHFYEQKVRCLNGASECCPYGFRKVKNLCAARGKMYETRGILCPKLSDSNDCTEYLVTDTRGKMCPDAFIKRGVCRVR